MDLLASISNVDVLVIGAGPTGLGAAKRLQQLVDALLPRRWYRAVLIELVSCAG